MKNTDRWNTKWFTLNKYHAIHMNTMKYCHFFRFSFQFYSIFVDFFIRFCGCTFNLSDSWVKKVALKLIDTKKNRRKAETTRTTDNLLNSELYWTTKNELKHFFSCTVLLYVGLTLRHRLCLFGAFFACTLLATSLAFWTSQWTSCRLWETECFSPLSWFGRFRCQHLCVYVRAQINFGRVNH